MILCLRYLLEFLAPLRSARELSFELEFERSLANRDNHYEAAFEAFLRARRLPYVAVDEARRSLVADGSLKSLDFIVSPPGRSRGWST